MRGDRNRDKIREGKENYIKSSEDLGVDPDVARRRADHWETAMRTQREKRRIGKRQTDKSDENHRPGG